MLRALDARDPRSKYGRELAAIEVPPRPLLGVVVDPKFPAALRACELLGRLVIDEHFDAPLLHRELDACNAPRFLDPQKMTVQLSVLTRSGYAEASKLPIVAHGDAGCARVLRSMVKRTR